MTKRFWSSSQKPKKNWEQYTSRDSSLSGTGTNKPPSKPPLLSSQGRTPIKGKMEWGFDPWASPSSVSRSEDLFQSDGSRPAGVPLTYPDTKPQSSSSMSRSVVEQQAPYRQMQQQRQPLQQPSQLRRGKHIIPGVSKMTMRQILSVVFSAFWDRADLYTDVLALENDKPTLRQLKLAFFRQGRIVLATPIESPDDMTMLSAGVRGILRGGDACSTVSVVQSGTPVSRKAKLKFQAISLVYELLRDESKRNAYDAWKMWNSRLPPPVEKTTISNQGISGSPIDTMTHTTSLRKTAMDDNVAPILRKSTSHRRRRKKKVQDNRKISWNEEVEELTIVEELPPYDPLVDDEDKLKENLDPMNYHGVPDPYGDSAEDWFGTIDLPDYDRHTSRRDQKQMSRKSQPVLFAQAADMGSFGEVPSVNKLRSLNSQTAMTPMDEDPTAGMVFEDPNDSLMVILDGPPEKERPPEKKFGRDLWNGFEDESWNNSTQDFVNAPLGIGKNGGQPHMSSPYNAVQGNIEANESTKKPPLATPPITNRSKLDLGATTTAIPILPKNPEIDHDDGGSLMSGSLTSWESSPTIEQHNDCDIGRTVDLAKGFQASLSNYINAAVEDMKEGLQMMGKQWDELEIGGTASENKNFFFLETGELDAMMGILKKEMDTLATPFNRDSRVALAEPSNGQKPESKRLFGNLFSRHS